MGELARAASTGPRPFPPGDYEVVVVGSGPGGLQTSYCLSRLGVPHAVVSADERPGGMFLRWPMFQNLISWTELDAPVAHHTTEYERYDQNSLVADEPELRARVAASMGREGVLPSRSQMEAGLSSFADAAGIAVRYGCRWETTRREDGSFVLTTTDGEYRCRAAVFALGVTVPWKAPVPGIEAVPHYAEISDPSAYQDKRVLVIGKRNSGFEVGNALLPWARQLVLVSPQPVRTDVLAHATVRTRYLMPLEVDSVGGGAFVLDAAVERVERTADGYTVWLAGTTHPGEIALQVDEAIVATGFQTPLGDLPDLGLATVAQGRIPALTSYWEATTVPMLFVAGNASQGAPELRKYGFGSASTSVKGFRYNARILARHLADRLGYGWKRPPVGRDEVVPLLARALVADPALWSQKGYLARALTLSNGGRDEGAVPLAAFLDEEGTDAIAVAVEVDADGVIHPTVYLRRDGRFREERLDPDLMHAFDREPYRRALADLVWST